MNDKSPDIWMRNKILWLKYIHIGSFSIVVEISSYADVILMNTSFIFLIFQNVFLCEDILPYWKQSLYSCKILIYGWWYLTDDKSWGNN